MTYINPISGTAMAAAAQQELSSAERSRQLKKQEAARRISVADAVHFEHAVEHAEEVSPVQDDPRRRQNHRRQPPHRHPVKEGESGPSDEEPPHIDVTG